MRVISTERLSSDQEEEARAIWNAEYPAFLKHEDGKAFRAYLNGLGTPKHFLLLGADDVLLGWLATFEREGERWLVMLVSGEAQSKGGGFALLDAALYEENELCGWVVDHDGYFKADGSPYRSPLAFYLKHGFALVEGVRFERDGLSAAKVRWQRG